MKIPEATAAVDKESDRLKNLMAWDCKIVKDEGRSVSTHQLLKWQQQESLDTIPSPGGQRRGMHAFTCVGSSKVTEITGKEFLPVWIRISPRRRPNIWDLTEEPVVLLERNLCVHPFTGPFWKHNWKKSFGTDLGISFTSIDNRSSCCPFM